MIWLPFRRCLPLAAHLMLILIGLPLLAFYPPAQGAMLLVPMTADARGAMLPVALAHGGRMMARGSLPGSIVMWGDRAALAAPLLGRAVLVMAADAAGCGFVEGRRA